MTDQQNESLREQQIVQIEKDHDFIPSQILGCPPHCQILYHEVRRCFIKGYFFACIVLMGSAIEAFLAGKIPFEDLKKRIDPKKMHYQLSLYRLIKIAREESLITKDLTAALETVRIIRHGVAHAREGTFYSMLGFKLTGYSGKGIISRGAYYESPTREHILPLPPNESAEVCINTFLQTVKTW